MCCLVLRMLMPKLERVPKEPMWAFISLFMKVEGNFGEHLKYFKYVKQIGLCKIRHSNKGFF